MQFGNEIHHRTRFFNKLLVIKFDITKANCAFGLSYDMNLHGFIDHRSNYIVHCIAKPDNM